MPDPILKLLKELKRSDVALCLARVPDSTRLFFGSSDAGVYEVDAMSEKGEARRFEGEGHTSYVTGVALAGGQVVSGGYDRQLIWWDAASGKPLRVAKAHDRWIRRVLTSPDGKVVVSVADDMVARVWEASTGKLRHELRGHAAMTPHNFDSMLHTCAFSPDSKLLVTGDKTGHIVVWSVETGKPVKTLEAPGCYTWDPRQRIHSIGGIRSLAFSPDGAVLAVGGMGKVENIDHLGGKARLELFDWQKGESLAALESDKYKGVIAHLEFHPQGAWLLGCGGDGKGWALFTDVAARKFTTQDALPMHTHQFALSEKGDRLFAAGHNRVGVWDIVA